MDGERKNKGLTLLDLMVTVAIAVILAGLFLPVLGAAREQDESVRCLSNLERLGKVAHMYMADYDGYLWSTQMLIPATGARTAWNWGWLRSIAPDNVLAYFDTGPSRSEESRVVRSEMLSCPSRENLRITDRPATWDFNWYGMNHVSYNLTRWERGAGWLHDVHRKASEIEWPSRHGVFMDSRANFEAGASGEHEADYYRIHPSGSDVGGYRAVTDFVHGGRCNVWFLDGHAAGLTRNQIPNAYPDAADRAVYTSFWHWERNDNDGVFPGMYRGIGSMEE